MTRKTKILLPLLVVAAAVVVAAILVKSAPSPPTQEPVTPPPLVRVIEVEPRVVRFDVESQGTVRPRTEATLNAQAPRRIEWVSPSSAEGGLFRRGDLAADGAVGDGSPLTLHELQLAEARAAVEVPQPSDPSSP